MCPLEGLCFGRCSCPDAQRRAPGGRISVGTSERNLHCKLPVLTKQRELQEQTLSKELLWPQVAESSFNMKMTYFGKKSINPFLKGYYPRCDTVCKPIRCD